MQRNQVKFCGIFCVTENILNSLDYSCLQSMEWWQIDNLPHNSF